MSLKWYDIKKIQERPTSVPFYPLHNQHSPIGEKFYIWKHFVVYTRIFPISYTCDPHTNKLIKPNYTRIWWSRISKIILSFVVTFFVWGFNSHANFVTINFLKIPDWTYSGGFYNIIFATGKLVENVWCSFY